MTNNEKTFGTGLRERFLAQRVLILDGAHDYERLPQAMVRWSMIRSKPIQLAARSSSAGSRQ